MWSVLDDDDVLRRVFSADNGTDVSADDITDFRTIGKPNFKAVKSSDLATIQTAKQRSVSNTVHTAILAAFKAPFHVPYVATVVST